MDDEKKVQLFKVMLYNSVSIRTGAWNLNLLLIIQQTINH